MNSVNPYPLPFFPLTCHLALTQEGNHTSEYPSTSSGCPDSLEVLLPVYLIHFLKTQPGFSSDRLFAFSHVLCYTFFKVRKHLRIPHHEKHVNVFNDRGFDFECLRIKTDSATSIASPRLSLIRC